MAAKNHAAIMPDANKEATINSLVGAAFGAAGQRCMALSTAVFIGESKEWYVQFLSVPLSWRVSVRASLLVQHGP
jgi:malonate-semialdehyde dehydrogenase (acetylating)/methylmalonate-semialdehyde dehydrogenase